MLKMPPAKEIAADRNLLEVFTNQLTVRINDGGRYEMEEVATALKDLSD
jgi:hypothetical protein